MAKQMEEQEACVADVADAVFESEQLREVLDKLADGSITNPRELLIFLEFVPVIEMIKICKSANPLIPMQVKASLLKALADLFHDRNNIQDVLKVIIERVDSEGNTVIEERELEK